MKIFYRKEEMEENMIIFHRIGWKELSYYHKDPPKISFPKGIDTYVIKHKILHSKILCFMAVVKNLQTSLKVSNPQNVVLCVLKT